MQSQNKPPFEGLINLASPHLGTRAVSASDEFFAPAARMLQDSEPVFRPDVFDEHGKWMDGWETRRRRGGGDFDEAIIRLGAPGEIEYADLDARHFTGNFPPAAQLCGSAETPDGNETWLPLIEKTELRGDSQNLFETRQTGAVNWVRLRIYPDGGIARLRLYGKVRPNWDNFARGEIIELSSLQNGGRIVAYNDAHYGNVHALISIRNSENMGDGWETRRRRDPGHDWIIVALGGAGNVRGAVVDTAHFRGNYPEFCSLQGARLAPDADADSLVLDADSWDEIIPKTKLEANRLHRFGQNEIANDAPINYVRLNIYPDGGVARLRIFGALSE
ncbi:MAG: allantoicase [Gammaproteobacteria bacterium]